MSNNMDRVIQSSIENLWRDFMKIRTVILALLFTVFFTVSCTTQQGPVGGVASSVTEEGDIEKVKITADKASIRQGCSKEANVLETSNKNSTLDVVNQVENWYAVKLPNNMIGFIDRAHCTPIVVEDKKPTPKAPSTPGTTQTNPMTNMDPSVTPGTTIPGTGTDTELNTTPGMPDTIPDTTPGTTPNIDNMPGTTPDTAAPNNETEVPGTDMAQADTANVNTNFEQEMLQLVNQARTENNLTPLTLDAELANVARIKSQDMIDNNYFSHNSPKYGSPFDMMKNFGIHYVKAGENIAGNQSVQKAHETLMNSPGHRKNILSPDYTHIGIGIKQGGQYSNMFTQMFISKPK